MLSVIAICGSDLAKSDEGPKAYHELSKRNADKKGMLCLLPATIYAVCFFII